MKIEGVVKWFSDAKGFGFLKAEGQPKDVFVHHTDILGEGFRSLAEGEAVSFELAPNPEKGPRAVSVAKKTSAK